MYLLVFITGAVATIHENLSATDILAVKAGTLRVCKFIQSKGFYELVIGDQLTWKKISEAKVLTHQDIRLHIPQ